MSFCQRAGTECRILQCRGVSNMNYYIIAFSTFMYPWNFFTPPSPKLTTSAPCRDYRIIIQKRQNDGGDAKSISALSGNREWEWSRVGGRLVGGWEREKNRKWERYAVTETRKRVEGVPIFFTLLEWISARQNQGASLIISLLRGDELGLKQGLNRG